MTNDVEKNELAEVPGFDGAYWVSKYGECFSYRTNRGTLSDKPHKLVEYVNYCKSSGGIVKVTLTNSGHKNRSYSVLRLMADSWYGEKAKGKIAYHINGNPFDNSLSNIGLGIRKEVSRKVCGTKSRKPVAKINEKGEVMEYYPSIVAAAKCNHYEKSSIGDRCRGKVKNPFKDTGYTFVYASKIIT